MIFVRKLNTFQSVDKDSQTRMKCEWDLQVDSFDKMNFQLFEWRGPRHVQVCDGLQYYSFYNFFRRIKRKKIKNKKKW